MTIPETTREHYLTGKAALNIPHVSESTGGWHFISYFLRDKDEGGRSSLDVAGINYHPSTVEALGDIGVMDVAHILKWRGVRDIPDVVYAANHPRAYVDLLVHVAYEFTDGAPERHKRLSKKWNLQKPLVAYDYPYIPFTPWDDFSFSDDAAQQVILPLLTKAVTVLSDKGAQKLISWFKQELHF